jgi:hypothetical protein
LRELSARHDPLSKTKTGYEILGGCWRLDAESATRPPHMPEGAGMPGRTVSVSDAPSYERFDLTPLANG